MLRGPEKTYCKGFRFASYTCLFSCISVSFCCCFIFWLKLVSVGGKKLDVSSAPVNLAAGPLCVILL